MDACKSCKKENPRPLSLMIEEEPTKKVRNYQWATAMKDVNLFTLTPDVEEMSVYADGEQLFKSHVMRRNYFCIEYEGALFGLSPACQGFIIVDQVFLSQFGLKLQEKNFLF